MASAINRRGLLATTAITTASAVWPRRANSSIETASDKPLTTRGVGNVQTPVFYRHDIGAAPARLHEPSVSSDGQIWTSPLDGNLWRYHAPTGDVEFFNLKKLTGREWAGLHLWPVAYGSVVLFCTPRLPELWVWNRKTNRVATHPFPHKNPSVYGGFAVEPWKQIYLYDTKQPSVVLWDPHNQRGETFACPYKLTGVLYMMFVDHERREIWGSTWNGNDIVCFDLKAKRWKGHYRCPLKNTSPIAGGKVFDSNTLYASDMLRGRLLPLDVETGKWGDPLAVPGYRKWYGYLSGGFLFGDNLYFDHSTWIGGADSIDGEPHHFIGSWTVFDPQTRQFSRLDFPTRPGERLTDLQSDYCASYNNELYLLAVNRRPPMNVVVLRSKPLSAH